MASINTWYNMQNKKAEKNAYITRRDQVQNIKNSINNVSDDYVNAINNKIGTLNSSLSAGIKGISIISSLKSNVSEKKEKIGLSDPKLSNYDNELSAEIWDCQRKIDSLDAEISALQVRYYNEVAAEQEAARRAMEELANKGKDLLGV